MKRKILVRIEYPENLVTEPILHVFGQLFKDKVTYSVIRADVVVETLATGEKKRWGFTEVELRGGKNDLEEAIKYLTSEGVGLIIFGKSPFGFLRIPAGGFKKMEAKNENDK